MTYIQPILKHPLVLVFLFINLAIGWWAHRKVKADSFEDYATASKNLPTGVLVMTILATLVSDREVSIIDGTFEFGIVIPLLSLAQFILAVFFIGIFISPRLVYYEEPTLGGVMSKFYGKWVQLLTGVIHFVFSVALLISLISSIGLISERLLGIDFIIGLLFFGGIAVLYSAFGGMRSVSYTDVIQLVMVLFVLFWVAQKVMFQTGGMIPLLKKVQHKDPSKLALLSRSDLFQRIKIQLYTLLSFYIVMSPPLVHRMLMVKDKNKVSRTWYTTAFVYGLITAMLLIIGLFGVIQEKKLGLIKGKNVFTHLVKYVFEEYPSMVDLISLGIIGMLISTMDSLLHTLGITIVKDVISPTQSLLGKKEFNERKQITVAKISVLFVGIIIIFIGLKTEHVSTRFIRRALVMPLKPLLSIVTIPFILGVMGLKPDKYSFFSFLTTSLAIFLGQKIFFPWRAHLGHRADCDYFFIALPLALLVYFITHIYVNKGVALVKRGEDYTFQKTFKFSYHAIKGAIVQRIKTIFNLPQIARQETSKRPAHALVFSIFMFFLYGLGSVAGVGKDDTTISFIMSIYSIGICLCVGLMLQGIWPLHLKPYFPLYWLGTLFFCLPLGGTLSFLRVHENMYHIFFFVISFALLSYLVSSRVFVWMTFLGVALAWGGWYSIHGHLPEPLYNEVHVCGYIGLAILVLCVLFFGSYFENHIYQQLYLKNVFGHAVTHEASQPLNEVSLLSGVQANAVTALDPIKNEAGKRGFFVPEENVEAIRDGSEAITKALQEVNRDFMHFRTLMSKEISQVSREKVYMKSLVDYIVLTLPKRYTSQVDVKVVCKKDFQAMLIRPFFTNVIVNFLINAFKHGLATEMVIEIDGSERKICVRDNGKGIPDEVMPHIFKFRFTTGDEKSKGVGLAFVRLILDGSGVKIETHSKRGEGSFTEFVLTFPEA